MDLSHVNRCFAPDGNHNGALAPTAGHTLYRRLALRQRLQPPRPAALETPGKTRVRRVRAGDADAFQAFIMGLSPASRRMRFHGAINACSPALLQYLTQTDNPRHQAWLAFDGAGAEQAVVGEARFVVSGDGPDAEFAIVVADNQRGRGLADRLFGAMVEAAASASIGVLFGDVLEDNARMFGFLRRHRFEIDAGADVEAGVVRWQRRLVSAPTPSRAPGLASIGARQGFDRWPAPQGAAAVRSLIAAA